MQNGLVDCIVVKDLSRFGREYIDAGRYIERLFPAMGVRFIAINDNYDSVNSSGQSDEIVIPFKNLINDAYCRDISIKIRSHLEVKRQNGEFVGNYCVYGYRKSEENHNRLEPDEYAGHVVQDMFQWVKNGMSLDAVSKKLNALGVLSPMEYKLSNGENYKCSFKKKETCEWTPTAVRRIVTNPIYTGMLVQGRVTTPNHKVKTQIQKEADEWAVVENSHEALVRQRDFDIVQRLLAIDMRTSPGQDFIYTMSGIAVCADCGALMTRKVSTVSGKKYVYYLCSNYKKFKRCTSHRIREEELEQTVLSTLKELIGQLLNADEVIRQAGEMQNRRIDIQKMEERIQANEEDINRYNRMLVSLYEDYKEGIVDKKDFQLIKENFEQKKTIAEQAIRNIEKEAETAAQERDSDRSWIEEYRENRNISSLTRSLVVNLIKEVRVYEKGNLEVVLDCDDKFHSILEQAARIQNIKTAERMAV